MNFKKIRPLHVGEKIVDKDGGVMQGFNLLWQQLFGNGDFVNAELGGKQAADADLDALSALGGTGIVVRSGDATYVLRSVTAGTGISVTDGSGVSGNPTIACTITGFTDEAAQDAIGTILLDSSTIDFTYDDATPSISASIVAGSIGATELSSTTVLAGTYGDASNVAQFVVDQDGRLTFAANVPVSGGGGGGSWIPLVDGVEPPGFITDAAGVLLLVAGP